MTRMSPERARAARDVAQALPAWGQLRVVRALPGGNRASVFLVVRDGNDEVARDAVGERFVAKTTSRTPAAVAWAAALARRARRAGLAASGYLATADGRWMVGGVTLQPFVDGRPATAAERRAASARLRSLHAATARMRQRPGFAGSTALLSRRRGGDVDLDAMPESLVRLCRDAWRPLRGWPRAAIHGDLNGDNVLVGHDGRLVLLDWDECRVDARCFDELGWLGGGDHSRGRDARPSQAETRRAGHPAAMAEGEREPVRRAFLAWEVAVCWTVEPTHARTVASTLGWHGR